MSAYLLIEDGCWAPDMFVSCRAVSLVLWVLPTSSCPFSEAGREGQLLEAHAPIVSHTPSTTHPPTGPILLDEFFEYLKAKHTGGGESFSLACLLPSFPLFPLPHRLIDCLIPQQGARPPTRRTGRSRAGVAPESEGVGGVGVGGRLYV